MPRLATAIALVAALTAGTAALAAKPFPATIPLPNGWQPEGIAVGKGKTFYAGSLATGAVYRGDLRTGKGAVFVPPHQGRVAVGLKIDRRGRIFVAGGATGSAYVYDAKGGDVASYQLASGQTFINDVVVTRTAAWFTDSQRPFLYRVDISAKGALAASAVPVPLTGDLVFQTGFNVNGIDATPDGDTLIVVQSNTGRLYRVAAATGATSEIVLSGGNAQAGDGILLAGRTLYVVQNQLNRVAVVKLAADLASGVVQGTITDSDLDVPTTIARFGNALYAVNARFGTTPTPSTPYTVVRLPRKP